VIACSRIVLSTRSPAARIGPPIDVDLPREAAVVPGAVDLEDEPLGGPAHVGALPGRADDEAAVGQACTAAA
jgi:hypothetical protein